MKAKTRMTVERERERELHFSNKSVAVLASKKGFIKVNINKIIKDSFIKYAFKYA